jgi:hypothetical protein
MGLHCILLNRRLSYDPRLLRCSFSTPTHSTALFQSHLAGWARSDICPQQLLIRAGASSLIGVSYTHTTDEIERDCFCHGLPDRRPVVTSSQRKVLLVIRSDEAQKKYSTEWAKAVVVNYLCSYLAPDVVSDLLAW